MLNYRPILSLPADLDAGVAAVERFGGRPWGLADALWPVCKECGGRQSLLAQLSHHPERLDLGAQGRMLFVFYCNNYPGMCDSWGGSSGANACFVLDAEQLEGTPFDHPPAGAIDPDDHAVVISSWQAFDDGFDEATAKKLLTLTDYDDLPDSALAQLSGSTHLGGVPWWIQDANEAPGGDWTFVGQLDTYYSFHEPPKSETPWISCDEKRYEGRTHVGTGPNFGDAGMGYIFLRSAHTRPEGWFFWQCS